MKRRFKKTDNRVRSARMRTRHTQVQPVRQKVARAFDAVAYAAALEVLG